MTGETPPVRIEADYLVETIGDPARAVETMAGEQSSGTFVPVPGETPELKARSAARVERLEILDERVETAALPTTAKTAGAEIRRARATLSWPLDNLGPSLPNLMATVAGNLFELRAFTGLRLLDIRLPGAFADAYPGPRHGIAGTRRLSGVADGPVIGTIIKPSVGLGPEETAALVESLCAGGIDFIKDDELQADGPACPFDDRVRAVMRVVNAHADRTGRKPMVAFNLTGDLDQMRRRHDLVLAEGGTCVMASLNAVGLVGMIELGRFSQLPIHAHRNGWGALTRHPLLGWSYVAWQKVWRLAGADHMHVNGLANKFSEDDDSVVASARTCLTPLFPDKPCLAMPVFSSGQGVRQAPGTYAALGTTDLIVTAGGGIVAHPGGPGAGVRALRQAWDAAVAGIPLDAHARDHRELEQALGAAA
ncbi:ribulose-bisphosphate carboxylase large subunit family protein [Methylobacterium sp. NEAU 140]|uniref:ribulose-bisphosphate carboxylase large subunit family protein n=1 Tax=Methylobacterium sp. NEAU 140 TaxID=3064945 RepID=UPI002733017E|nr:ribulose-bisphosphate carboxylase large subunit family protein [Methylobacterium sp. NEAU 140]MDP4022978.1 ribulose-bisphosphate carboxylase large subunit family protein [Methylobacterium sp. NEAU 140]